MSMVILHYLVHIKIKICLENIKLKTKDVRNDNVYFFLC